MPSTRWLAPIGLALFAWIVWSAGPEQLVKNLLSVNPVYLLLAVSLVPFNVLLKGAKWKLVLGKLGQKVSLACACRNWLIGLFVATLTPGRLGDFVKALYARDAGLPLGAGTAAVFVERLIDLVALFSLAAMGVVTAAALLGSETTSIVLLVSFIVGGLVSLWAVTQRNVVAKVAKPFFNHIIPQRYKDTLRVGFGDMYNSISSVTKKPLFLLSLLFLTYLSWVMSSLTTWLIALSLGIEIPLVYIVTFVPIATILELIPITVAGFGTREATFVFLFGALGIAASSVIAMSLLGVVVSFATAAVGGALWLRYPIHLSGSSIFSGKKQ